MNAQDQARYIDHSVLKPEFTFAETKAQIEAGIAFGCRTVCINPWAIDLAKKLCQKTTTGVCVVCDFPFGQSETVMKAAQAEAICEKGIDELDLVANYGWIRSGKWPDVQRDVAAVAAVCQKHGVTLKTIIESDALDMAQILRCVDTLAAAGSDFIKTSTGFYSGGKSEGAAVPLMQKLIAASAGKIKVKGSGGIRSREHFQALLDLGIDRMGIGYRSTPVVLGLDEAAAPEKSGAY